MKINKTTSMRDVQLITLRERQEELSKLMKLTAVIACISGLPDLYYQMWQSVVLLVVAMMLMAILYYYNSKGHADKVGHLLIFLFSVILFINSSQLGFECFSFLFYLPLIIVTPFIVDYQKKYLYYFHVLHPVIFIAILFATDFRLLTTTSPIPLSQSKVMAEFNLITSLLLSYYIVNLRVRFGKKSEEKYERVVQDLNTQNVQLQKTNNELDRFVYSVSHDLRAPIASSLGLVELSKAETNVDKLLQYNLLKEKTLRRLDDYVNSLLNFSRNYRVEVLKEKIDFRKIIEECIELNKPYGNNGSKLVVKIDLNEGVDFIGDSLRIRIILNNLISNALKYHDEGAQEQLIALAVYTDESKAVIKVRDNGIGIDADKLANVFDMFYRASETAKGSGLGLYITREVVDKMGGKVSVDSIVGSGTAFTVEIPNQKI